VSAVGRNILAFDLGTGGNKAVLYDEGGALLATAFCPYDTFYPQSGWAEQAPLDWWNSIKTSTRQVLGAAGAAGGSVGCLSISGHGIGVVPVDAKGALLRQRTLLWSDSRALPQMKRFFEKTDYNRWYRITGAALRAENYAVFKIMWHRDNEPELFGSTKAFLGTKDYINLLMTGAILSDYTDASFSGIYDLTRWRYSEELARAADLPLEVFPVLHPSTHVVGGLHLEPAEELGLARGTQVICGGYDGSCTALGAGNFTRGRVYNYVGSSSWISCASETPLIDEKSKPYCYASVVPGMFNSTVSIYSAGASFQWLRNTMCREEKLAGQVMDIDPYTVMEKEAIGSPVGANKLLFNPSLMGGSTIHPTPHIRGAYLGISLSHTKADLIRSTMEGVAMDLRFVLDVFRGLGIAAEEIRLVGGGSKGALWRQIFADVYEASIVLTNVGQEAAALGAATVGAIGAGIWKDFSVVDRIARTVDVAKPVPASSAVYRKLLPLHKFATEKLLEIGEKMASVEL
jgi:xylulokinase